MEYSGADFLGATQRLLGRFPTCTSYPKALRTHILWILGPKTILHKGLMGYAEP